MADSSDKTADEKTPAPGSGDHPTVPDAVESAPTTAVEQDPDSDNEVFSPVTARRLVGHHINLDDGRGGVIKSVQTVDGRLSIEIELDDTNGNPSGVATLQDVGNVHSVE